MTTKNTHYTIDNPQVLIATLFSDGGAVKKTSIHPDALVHAREILAHTGLMLVETEHEVSLRTTPECATAILAARTEELKKDIGPAGLEIISIVLYGENPTRAAIDYIRGVNSSGSLRTLRMRGLLTREKKHGGTGFVYTPTVELLAHLGIACASELPAYDEIRASLRAFLDARGDEESESETL